MLAPAQHCLVLSLPYFLKRAMENSCGVLRMEVNAELERELIELFDLEAEVLSAEVEYVSDDLKLLTIQVPHHKSGLIKEFILRSISKMKPESLN